MRTSWKAAALVAAAAATLVGAVSAFGGVTKTIVNVAAGKPSELKFTLSSSSAAKGAIAFRVTNRGKLDHDFKIAGKKTVRLKPGKTTTLLVTIAKPGKYPYLCTVAGHAAGGMKGTFTVRK